MIQKLINQSKTEDVLFMAGAILSIINEQEYGDDSRKSMLPELFSTMGLEGTINLIKYFGGETIHIPTHQEMYKSFLIIVSYYKKKIGDMSWENIKNELGVEVNPHTLGKIIQTIDERFAIETEELKDLGIDKILSKLKSPNAQEEARV